MDKAQVFSRETGGAVRDLGQPQRDYKGTFNADIKTHFVTDFVILETTLPLWFYRGVNHEIDELKQAQKQEDYSDQLVGQIHNGEQLYLDKEWCDPFHGIYGIAESMAMQYVQRFYAMQDDPNPPYVAANCYEAWVVDSLPGDYNPIHDHGKRTAAGLSFVFWTRVPENMRNTEAPTLKSSSGQLDGCITFVNGPTLQTAHSEFRTSKVMSMDPQPGRFVIFPHWLNHMVYPFRASLNSDRQEEFDRRSISGNIALFTEDQVQRSDEA